MKTILFLTWYLRLSNIAIPVSFSEIQQCHNLHCNLVSETILDILRHLHQCYPPHGSWDHQARTGGWTGWGRQTAPGVSDPGTAPLLCLGSSGFSYNVVEILHEIFKCYSHFTSLLQGKYGSVRLCKASLKKLFLMLANHRIICLSTIKNLHNLHSMKERSTFHFSHLLMLGDNWQNKMKFL